MDPAKRRYAGQTREAGVESGDGRAVPVRSQPQLSLDGDDLHGKASLANAFWAILFLPATMVVIRRGVIEREERYLERKFGEEYLR
jgi:hypothetical protein